MAAEILKTLEYHNLESILLLGGVILIRVILALVIHYEIKDHGRQQNRNEYPERKRVMISGNSNRGM